MARITVEDCIQIVHNRFELVLFAAKRARFLAGGAPLTVLRDNDKNPVVALREIAEKTVSTRDLEEDCIRSMQRVSSFEEDEGELEDGLEETYTAELLVQPIALDEEDEEDEHGDDEILEEEEDDVAEAEHTQEKV